jgi:hypothetical protein
MRAGVPSIVAALGELNAVLSSVQSYPTGRRKLKLIQCGLGSFEEKAT